MTEILNRGAIAPLNFELGLNVGVVFKSSGP